MARLRFDDFMQEALYHPTEGYYTQGAQKVGKAGDFFTSVSVGSLFGELLCERFFLFWQELKQPKPFFVYELGANDGSLCADILQAAQKKDPFFEECLHYIIIEPLEALHALQKKKTQAKATLFSSIKEAKKAHPHATGIVFGNELLDALPVRLARFTEKGWQELFVQKSPQKDTADCPPSPQKPAFTYEWEEDELKNAEHFPIASHSYPLGYTTEWQDTLPTFMEELSGLLEKGLFLFIDYGRSEQSYYAPERHDGTLRTYYQHQRTDNPLLHVGEQDITADVNFTAVARAAQKRGLIPQLFLEQARWLISLAKPLLLEWEKELTCHHPAQPNYLDEKSLKTYQKRVAQFQTLTHPAHMGHLFHVLELGKKLSSAPTFLSEKNQVHTL